tara:strand:+ start:12392 stop:12733 length:342 start_codon:yes stop_codon:yes gene_type:complete
MDTKFNDLPWHEYLTGKRVAIPWSVARAHLWQHKNELEGFVVRESGGLYVVHGYTTVVVRYHMENQVGVSTPGDDHETSHVPLEHILHVFPDDVGIPDVLELEWKSLPHLTVE